MAEKLAEIDLISRGRLITGWVRGAGSEQFFNNANPAMREYAKELELPDSYERTPGSVKANAGVARAPVVDRGPIEALGLQ